MKSSSAGSIFVDLLLSDAGYNQAWNKNKRTTSSAVRAIEVSISGLTRSIATIAPALAGAFSVGALFDKYIKNTIDAQNEQAQLAAILKSTGSAAGLSANQLNNMADAMSRSSSFSAGDITRAQTRLLSYAGILGENIPRAMQAVIDQSARLGISVESSAETIGRALEQPSKAAAALSRQGFGSYFTKETIAMLKALEKQGRMAEAQVKILEVLEESYAGAALAARETLGGSLAALNNSINDLLTGDGGPSGLTRSINDVTDSIHEFNEFISSPEFSEGITTIYEGFNLIADSAFISVSKIGDLVGALARFRTASADFFQEVQNREARFFGNDYFKKAQAGGFVTEATFGADLGVNLQRDWDKMNPRSPSRPVTIVDEAAQKKAAAELNRIYENRERIIKGLTQEQMSFNDLTSDLNRLVAAGKITDEERWTAIKFYMEETEEDADDWSKQMEAITKRAAENMQDAFADFLFDPFSDGLDGMLKGFIDTLRRMAAEQLAANIFGSLGGATGLLGGIFGSQGSIARAISGVEVGPLQPFFAADGGTFGPGRWGVVGEEGPELLYTGQTGATIIPNDKIGGGRSGNVYNIDARGADAGAVARLEQSLISLAGPGVIERRVNNAQVRGQL